METAHPIVHFEIDACIYLPQLGVGTGGGYVSFTLCKRIRLSFISLSGKRGLRIPTDNSRNAHSAPAAGKWGGTFYNIYTIAFATMRELVRGLKAISRGRSND